MLPFSGIVNASVQYENTILRFKVDLFFQTACDQRSFIVFLNTIIPDLKPRPLASDSEPTGCTLISFAMIRVPATPFATSAALAFASSENRPSQSYQCFCPCPQRRLHLSNRPAPTPSELHPYTKCCFDLSMRHRKINSQCQPRCKRFHLRPPWAINPETPASRLVEGKRFPLRFLIAAKH